MALRRYRLTFDPLQNAQQHVYIVMDYCSGGDLSQYIKERGKIESLEYVPEPGAAPMYYPHPKTGGLDERVVRSLLLQLADALKFLRGRDLMHRDLKPQVSTLQHPRLITVSNTARIFSELASATRCS